MNDRMCITCGRLMEVIKNGFHHLGPDGGIRAGDLWYCYACDRFQVHGIAGEQHPWWPLHGLVRGKRIADTDGCWLAYLEPEIHFLPAFHEHIRRWYPELKLRKDEWYK